MTGPRLAALVLAADESRRFGASDKLLAPVNGAPMVAASMRLSLRPGISRRLVVASAAEVGDLARALGLDALMVRRGQPQSHSLRVGLHALRAEADRILVLLGDMPFLHAADIDALIAMPPDLPVCATDGQICMPPALFPAPWFDRLAATEGDRGAGGLLAEIPAGSRQFIRPERLRDIDRPADLP